MLNIPNCHITTFSVVVNVSTNSHYLSDIYSGFGFIHLLTPQIQLSIIYLKNSGTGNRTFSQVAVSNCPICPSSPRVPTRGPPLALIRILLVQVLIIIQLNYQITPRINRNISCPKLTCKFFCSRY